jgi:hypothetical protein
VFHWLDAVFAIDRETAVLRTMNGQQTFEWSDNDRMQTTLDEAGLGKMVALRVTVKKSDTTDEGKEQG